MYHIHTTPGIILDSKNYGEAGKLLKIFTRNYGLVLVIAQGIRLEKSKLRYFTQEYTVANFSLVKGKEYWRLTSVSAISPEKNVENLHSNMEKVDILNARLCKMLSRLLQGEERHEELYDMVHESITFMYGQENLNENRLKTLESVIVYRILKILGYIGEPRDIKDEVFMAHISLQLLDDSETVRNVINHHVNKALIESHL